ncbi:MAG: type II secretion system protein GspG [Planctomycetota bacterium]|nr:type II secretion system protein GspG [Planctomycetota bacterium]
MQSNRTVRTILVVVLAVLLWGCSERAAERRYREGQKQLEAGRLDLAVEAFDEVTRRWPKTDAAILAAEDSRIYRGLQGMERQYPTRVARQTMVTVARSLDRHRSRHGRYPPTLAELKSEIAAVPPRDPWGGPLRYARKARGRGYVLVCLGADGAPGGEGFAGDILVEDGAFVSSLSGAYP